MLLYITTTLLSHHQSHGHPSVMLSGLFCIEDWVSTLTLSGTVNLQNKIPAVGSYAKSVRQHVHFAKRFSCLFSAATSPQPEKDKI